MKEKNWFKLGAIGSLAGLYPIIKDIYSYLIINHKEAFIFMKTEYIISIIGLSASVYFTIMAFREGKKNPKENAVTEQLLRIIGTRDTENTILIQFNLNSQHDILDIIKETIDDNRLQKHYWNQAELFLQLFFSLRDKINNKTCSDDSIIKEFKYTFYYYQIFIEEVYNNLNHKLHEINLYDLATKNAIEKWKEFMELYNDYIFKKIKELFQNDVLLVNLKKLKEITYKDNKMHTD